MAKSQITDQIMLNALVERNLAEKTELQALLDKQKLAFQEHQSSIAGTAFLIDLKKKALLIQSYPERQEKAVISINPQITGHKFNPDDWERWGRKALLANPQDGNRQTEFTWDTEDLYGLVANKDKVYLYNDGQLDTEYLGLAKHALFKGVYKGKPATTPFDLFISPQQKWVCVTDRGAGTVTVIDAQTYAVKGTVSIRGNESVNTINLALDDQRNQAYVTDNQTSSLQIIDLNTLETTKQKVGLGILGNLLLAPDGKHLYIVSIKPNQGLHYINLEIWEKEKTIKLKGDLFKADSSDPCDLLSLAPDGESLLIMTYLNEPNPFTPVISVIDAKQVKTIRRYSLKDGIKPFQLAFGIENPVRPYTKTLEDMVIEAELVGAQALWNLKRELRLQLGLGEEPEEEVTSESAEPEVEIEEEPEEEPEEIIEEEPEEELEEIIEEEPEGDFIDIEQHTVNIDTLIKNNPESDTLNITPKKLKHIELPPEATKEILDIMVSTFQKQVYEDITEYEDIMQRMEQEADKARKQLEIYDSTVIQIEDLFEGQSLKTVIVREAITMMLDLRESVTQEARLVPTHCPNCNQRLNGSWDCTVCGFELESPDRARKRRIASADATANLPMGHLVIPDPQGMRLLQLNPYKYVAWHLDPDQLPADYPVDTLWLPNDNLLMTDKDGNAVIELGLRGKVYWTFNTRLSPQHELNEPVKATYYVPMDEGGRHFLIVDQGNHRILEVNRKSEIIKEFGIMGTSGDEATHLNTPSDVQFTHEETYLITDSGNNRVIEYKKEGGVEQIFGEELKLNRPTQAQRLFNGHTLIVDAGNYRVLQISAGGDIVHESFYFTKKMDADFQVVEPIKMIRLLNKDILIMDEDKLIQIMMHTNQLVWLSKIEDLAFQPKVEAPEIVIDEDGTERLVYKVLDHGEIKPVRLSQKINFKRMQKLIEARLKADATSEGGGDKQSSAADKLRALIEDRKIEQKRSLRRELTMDTFHPSEIFEKEDANLKNIRHYAIDRNHNALIRINRKGEVKWNYGFEMGQVLTRPHFVSETRRTLLVADTGNNRVVEISKADKEVIMDYRGPDHSKLAGSRSAMRRENGNTLIADTRNKRLIEANGKGDIVWEFNRSGQISSPQHVEELPSGHLLFTDSMLNSVREIDRDGNLRWSYGSRMKGKGPGQLFAPEYAHRLENGNTLIADTRNNRVLEVTLEGREIWMYEGDPISRKKVLNPNRLERMSNGNTLITYNNHREIIEVDTNNTTVWYFKMGNDVFQTPVTSETKGKKHMIELLSPYYNPIEKRLVKSAEGKAMWGMEAHITLMDNCQMKSVRASMVLMRLEQNGTVIKTFPSPEELLADKFGKHLIVAFIMDPGKDPEAVVDEVRYLAEVLEAKMERIVLEEAQVG